MLFIRFHCVKYFSELYKRLKEYPQLKYISRYVTVVFITLKQVNITFFPSSGFC